MHQCMKYFKSHEPRKYYPRCVTAFLVSSSLTQKITSLTTQLWDTCRLSSLSKMQSKIHQRRTHLLTHRGNVRLEIQVSPLPSVQSDTQHDVGWSIWLDRSTAFSQAAGMDRFPYSPWLQGSHAYCWRPGWANLPRLLDIGILAQNALPKGLQLPAILDGSSAGTAGLLLLGTRSVHQNDGKWTSIE